jgi:hypothetical protein
MPGGVRNAIVSIRNGYLMNKNSTKNGQEMEKPQLNSIQQLRWKNTFDLLRQHTTATEEEASEFAYRKIAVADEIERELART